MKLPRDIAINFIVKADPPPPQKKKPAKSTLSETNNIPFTRPQSARKGEDIVHDTSDSSKKQPSSTPLELITPLRHATAENAVFAVPTRIRKPKLPWEDPNKWNSSTTVGNRDELSLLMDNKISKFRKSEWAKEQATPAPCFEGPNNVSGRKTIHSSYSRHRNARTSGPVLNLDIDLALAQIPAPPTPRPLQENRWNVQTKDRDDEPRAKPNMPPSKDSESLKKAFRRRPKSASYIKKIKDDLKPHDTPEMSWTWSGLLNNQKNAKE